jgi:hypothetical protein
MTFYQSAKDAPLPDYRNVYLDQSAYGRMLRSGDWRKSAIGAVLLEAQAAGRAQIWAGPTNVIETIQATDPTVRKALASMILDLIDAKRIWWGHEFEAIQDFFTFLTKFAPGAIRYREYFDDRGLVARQTWLGALALTASTSGAHLGPLVESLRHTKALNRLLHARFALAPDEWVERMVIAAETLETTNDDPLADLDQLTTAEIEKEIGQLTARAAQLNRRTAAKLDKHRSMIARSYGGIEIGALLGAVFALPLELELTFDIPHIISRWPEIQSATGCKSLPKDIIEADERDKLGDASIARRVITQLIHASARKGLMTTYLGAQVIILEMQRCMNAREIPSGGLSFDADHAAALVRHHVFVTHDEWLIASLKTMAKWVEEQTASQWQPTIVDTPKQLERVLSRPM